MLSVAKNLYSQNAGDTLFQSSHIHRVDIILTQPNWWDSLVGYKLLGDSLQQNFYIPAKVFINGQLFDSVGIRLKGNSSFGHPGMKKPIKLSFNQYRANQDFGGLKKLNLHNSALDPTMMREKLMLDYLNKEGISAPRCTYATVSYNGQYVGLYKVIEEVDKVFLQDRFGENGGNLFKGDPAGNLMWGGSNPAAYYSTYELKTNELQNDWTDLVDFINKLNNTPINAYKDTMDVKFNTLQFLRGWAMNSLCSNYDHYFNNPHNYYLYHKQLNNQFEWICWDVSVAMGCFFPYWSQAQLETTSVLHILSPPEQRPLCNNLLKINAYKELFLNAICNYLDSDFKESILFPKIDSLARVLRPFVYAEPHANWMFPPPVFDFGQDTFTVRTPIGDIPGLKEWIINRRVAVLQELRALNWDCNVTENERLLHVARSDEIVQVFPNPFSYYANMIVPDNVEYTDLKVYNITGKEMSVKLKIVGKRIEIERGDLAKGLYFYSLIDKNQNVKYAGKMAVE